MDEQTEEFISAEAAAARFKFAPSAFQHAIQAGEIAAHGRDEQVVFKTEEVRTWAEWRERRMHDPSGRVLVTEARLPADVVKEMNRRLVEAGKRLDEARKAG
jgi:hypothetical protein